MSFGEGPGSPVARAAHDPKIAAAAMPQSAEFFPEDLGRAESDGDEVAQRAIEGRFLVCPGQLGSPHVPAAQDARGFESLHFAGHRAGIGVRQARQLGNRVLAIPDINFRQDCSCDLARAPLPATTALRRPTTRTATRPGRDRPP
jgi:hypothetical protein